MKLFSQKEQERVIGMCERAGSSRICCFVVISSLGLYVSILDSGHDN